MGFVRVLLRIYLWRYVLKEISVEEHNRLVELTRIIDNTQSGNSTSKETLWENTVCSKAILVKSDISPRKFKIFKSLDTFYLTSYSSKYIASIEGQEQSVQGKKSFLISKGYSITQSEAYKLLIMSVIEFTDIEFIFSNSNITENAKNFYSNLLTDRSTSMIHLLVDDHIVPYDKGTTYDQILKENKNVRIGLSIDRELLLERYKNIQDQINRGNDRATQYDYFYSSIYGERN